MNPQLDLFGWAPPAGPPDRPAAALPIGPGCRMLEIVGDAEPGNLIRLDHNRKDNTAELRLFAQISLLMDRSLPRFVSDLDAWMLTTSVGNHGKFWCYYKIDSHDDRAEIWHTNVQGDRDRHVCTITLNS